MDKWKYQNKPCYLENCVVKEPCKQRQLQFLEAPLVQQADGELKNQQGADYTHHITTSPLL